MSPALRVVLIGAAGAAGALSRYGVGVLVGRGAFPWATLGINVAGSFLLGLLVGAATVSSDARLVVGVGFLGAFTTFSTFTVDAVDLVREGRAGVAAAYVLASVLLGLAAAGAGIRLAPGS